MDYPSEQQFDECLIKFEITYSPWPMFVDYVNQTWLIPHQERFVKAWTNKVMHLRNTTTNMYEDSKFLLLSWFTVKWIKKIMFLYLLAYFICRVESAH